MLKIALPSSWLECALICFAVAAYAFSICCFLAQIFPNVVFFQLVVSFMPHSLVVGSIASLSLAFVRPKMALLGVVLVFVAGAPFILFSKFQSPSGHACDPGECLTLITANIYERQEAMEALSALAEREGADLIAINEAVRGMTDYSYQRAFPDHPFVVHAAWESMPRHMGNPITLLSRIPLADRDRVLRDDTAGRAYIVADLAGDWQGTRIAVAHAMAPLWKEGLMARDTLLSAAFNEAAEVDTFIMAGDFNLTPWTPIFRALPGKRAGDPRGVTTWPVGLRPVGLPIDHILFEGELELVESRVLDPIGSDHLPVLAKFRPR